MLVSCKQAHLFADYDSSFEGSAARTLSAWVEEGRNIVCSREYKIVESSLSSVLFDPSRGYILDPLVRDRVLRFLDEHPELIPVLEDISSELEQGRYFDRWTLALSYDEDEFEERIVIRIIPAESGEYRDMIAKGYDFLIRWWGKNLEEAKGKILFSIG